MSYFGEYLLKLSVGFGIICLFYQLVLKGLTFYKWNRFYLLGYSLLCFFIPLINISEVVQQHNPNVYKALDIIPSIIPGNAAPSSVILQGGNHSWTLTNLLFIVFISGIAIMTIRLVIQFIALRRLIQKAELVSDEEIKLYQVNGRIVPFAFGKSIFMNRQLHEAKDIEEIIRHEFVHIRQKHSIDIMWAELLCVFNWYNPFVWWIRNSIKQNLEYLADNKVLQDGIDKKQYQYLLLKVLGDHQFAIAHPFNFSSLKKRIAMMNKMKNTSIHLLKFLFIMPLIAVMIMAFRKEHSPLVNKTMLSLSGITFDKITELPISGVTVRDSASGTQTISDRNGFYRLTVPVKSNFPLTIHVDYQKEGYPLSVPLISTLNSISDNMIIIEGLVNERDKNRGIKPALHVFSSSQPGSNSYSYALEKFESHIFQKRIGLLVQNSTKPIWIIDGIPYAFMKDGVFWFDKTDVVESPECKVWFDGKIMSIGEANNMVNRFELKSIGAMPKKEAQKILGVNCNVLLLAKDSIIPRYKHTSSELQKSPVANVLNDNNDTCYVNIKNNFTLIVSKNKIAFTGDVTCTMLPHNKSKFPITAKAQGFIYEIKGYYVILNNSPAEFDKPYEFQNDLNAVKKFLVIKLNAEKAYEKYGEKGKTGAVEVISI